MLRTVIGPWHAGLVAMALLGASAAACVGTIGGESDETNDVAAPLCGTDPMPGPSPIRRMTRFEYDNTVRDLLGDDSRPASQFTEEEEAMGFNNNAQALVVTPLLAEKYMTAAEGVAERATADLEALTGCAPTAMDSACVRAFIDRFGLRAYRRPLSTAERDELVALYEAVRASDAAGGDDPVRAGISAIVEATLQSPQFLYRVELSGADGGLGSAAELGPNASTNAVPLTSWEMASRLSYLLWGSMPDDELFVAAAAGELATKEQIAAQARRMLKGDKARAAVDMFHAQWLDYDRVLMTAKDVNLFPEWSSELAEAMRVEMETFIDRVIFDGEGDFGTLLTAPYSYLDPALASFYGATPAEGEGFAKVELPGREHAGLLSMGAILSYYAHSNQTSPVHRGKLVREVFLCDVMKPPPADVQFNLPEPEPNSTARERFEQHSNDPACSGCHVLMDPLGFGFENFDAVGRFRTEDNGAPIDASGEITSSDVDGKFVGVVELASRLAESRETQDCYARQWFRWGYGRGETKDDACSTDPLLEAFDTSGGDVKELLVALTQTDAFLYRTAAELEGTEESK